MIALAPIVARLAAQCPSLRVVAGAAEFASVSDRVTTHPAAWVLPLADAAGENRFGAGATAQRVESGVGVVLVVGDRSDQQGGAVADALTTIRSEVMAALLGWTPSASTLAPFAFAEGSLLRFSAGLVWWQDSYSTAWEARAVSGA